MTEVNLKMIPLSDLVPSPTNPRKTFDQAKTLELAESIKEKGVLQPILVREKGKKYEIICGERRFRASQMVKAIAKEKNTIPAIIREMSDQEVRELQLIENFQREDVHPMEEALAIKYAIEIGNYTIDDLRAKVGKSVFYIKQRIKLNDLSDKLQKLFFNGNLNISTALQFAVLSADIQDEIIEDDYNFDELMKDPSDKVEVSDWSLNKYKGKLSEATFDIEDPKLLVEIGPCTCCKYNTGVALLFPEEAGTARCTNIGCFKLKTDTALQLEIEKAKEDPACVFVSTSYGSFDNPKRCNALIADGHEVYGYSAYSILDEPELSSLEDYKEDNDWDGCDDDDREEILEQYERDKDRYNQDLVEYENDKSSGKYQRALIVDGDNAGKTIYVKLNGKKSSSTQAVGKVDTEAEGVTAGDIDAEIARIKYKNERAKEIDENKIWDEIKKHFAPSSNSSVLKGEFTPLERKAIAESMFSKLGFREGEQFRKQFNWKVKKGVGEFPEVDETTLRQMTRFFFLSVLPPSMIASGFKSDDHTALSIKIAEEYFPSVLEEAVNAQKEKAEKREKNAAKKIAELQQKKKELKPKKPAVKKASK
jgi:ParB family transcriptional regulator, chromosome partitioning protein